MRALTLAALVAVGFALVGSSNVSAAPANGAAINESASANNSVQSVHWYERSRYYRHRCHYRYRSWGHC
jgi:hypothetical protein